MVALVFMPVIIFDIRHGFINLNALVSTFSNTSTINFDIFRVMQNLFESIFNTNFNILLTFLLEAFLLSGAFILCKIIRPKENYSQKMLQGFLLLLISPLIFIFYKGEISEYYLLYLYPVIILILIILWERVFFSKDKYKVLGIAVLIISLITPFIRSLNLSTTKGIKSYLDKREVVEFISLLTKNRSGYNVSYSVPVGEDSGFRYLVDYYQIKPSGIASDTLIQITYPNNIEKDDFNVNVYGIRVPPVWLEEGIKNE